MTCPFFDKLPAELRNNIYEFAFAPNDTDPVDLVKAQPPRKEFLLTCQQVYAEGAGLYREAYRRFWSSTDFILQLPPYTIGRQTYIDFLLQLRGEELEHITSLACKSMEHSDLWCHVEMIDPRGGWLYKSKYTMRGGSVGDWIHTVPGLQPTPVLTGPFENRDEMINSLSSCNAHRTIRAQLRQVLWI